MSERVLIVAKTQMKSGVCVGGLLVSSNRNVRLIPEDRQDRRNHPADTQLDVGQVWDMDYYKSTHIDPPHIEDIIVTDSHYKGKVTSLKSTLIQRITPWNGGLQALFDNNLTININSGKCYISRMGPIPNCSTGYWLPNRQLTLYYQNNTKPYYCINYIYKVNDNTYEKDISIPFVGCSDPIRYISCNVLVRVSLARWWPSGSEERCYLQISGFYE